MGFFDFLFSSESEISDDEKLSQFVFISIETSGTILNEDRITRICMIEHALTGDGSSTARLFSQFFDIGDRKINNLRGRYAIKQSDLRDAPTFAAEKEKIKEFIRERRLVSLRPLEDSVFLKEEFDRCNEKIVFDMVDFMAVLRRDLPGLGEVSFEQLCSKMKYDIARNNDTESLVINLYRMFIEHQTFKHL